jgi:hypothetical protein
MPRSLSSYKKEVVLAAAAYPLRRGPTMFAARAKKRSGSSARNERVSVWFRGLSVRNIALGTNRSSLGQVNAVLLGVCNNLKRVPKARPLRPVATLMYGVCRPLSVFHPSCPNACWPDDPPSCTPLCLESTASSWLPPTEPASLAYLVSARQPIPDR